MTAAQKFWEYNFDAEGYMTSTIEEFRVSFDAAIRLAQEESYALGFSDARERAAKICDGYSQFRYSADTMIEAENMAREIRALSPVSGQPSVEGEPQATEGE
jgi:hypothetical protein